MGEEKKGSERFTLKQRKEVKYTFDDHDVGQMLSELFTVRVIELPELKGHAEVNNNMTPIIFRYHRILSHLTKDCYVLKDMIDHVSHRNCLNKKKRKKKCLLD